MTTQARAIRSGLPRRPGDEPWPRIGDAAVTDAAETDAAETAIDVVPEGSVAMEPVPTRTVRRGLPRGEAAARTAESTAPTSVPTVPATSAVPPIPAPPNAFAPPAAPESPIAASAVATSGLRLRRGLPRVAGDDPWPAAGFAPARSQEAAAPAITVGEARPEPAVVEPAAVEPAAASEAGVGRPTRSQLRRVALAGVGLVAAAAIAVFAVRGLLGLEFMKDFLASYPGEYELPHGAPVGLPAWLGWQHFFNVFLMVLIIRSGLQVRTEKRPAAYWTPRWSKTRKISLSLWFHQSLDLLWVVNGVVFVVLLFVTGQWMRIVPTSWEVFPNALSAALQYVSLDWPIENGWVNYNGLQQLAYFTTVFLAAPLAVVTGVRMSGLWPKNATALSRLYPVEWARALHFPVMLYFVLFIFVHVVLVLATGALRNLNHMYGAQDAVNWVGFAIFAASLLVIAVGWVAARPLVLAPIARLFGKVSSR